MTVRQLHYTSCEDGLEGIQGFQVAAVTPDAPKPLVELAIRASAYEPGPGFVARAEDPGAFPVAFGYATSGRGAVLFQSRYVGADFTGRMGNYFAHALLFDDAERELGALLPIDMWRSPMWTHTRGANTSLTEVTSLYTDAMQRFPADRDILANLLSAVQRVLADGRGRVVLVVPDDESAARWLAAVCRSLPRALASRVSFVTYTSRPEETDVLLACTTPDVRLPPYGNFTTIDMTEPTRTSDGLTRYASVMRRLWETGEAERALSFAEQANPALTVTELDRFATLLEFEFDLPADEAGNLPAVVGLAVDRMPRRLSAQAWQRVADHVQDRGGPADLPRWSELLRAAAHQGEPVPASLYGTYFIAALGSSERVWLPKLDRADLEDVAENIVLPALSGTDVLHRLTEHRDLLDALIDVLDRRLADPREVTRLATTLSVPAAELLARDAKGSRLLLTDLVLARGGRKDPVKVLCKAAGVPGVSWRHFGSVLWPGELSTEDSMRLLAVASVPTLAETGLGKRIAQHALRAVGGAEVGENELRLVEAVLRSEVVRDLPPGDRDALRVAARIAHFRTTAPNNGSDQVVLSGLKMARTAPDAIRERLIASIASFVLRADPVLHSSLLELALDDHAETFLPAYRVAVRTDLATAPPQQVAAIIVVWRAIDNDRVRRTLTEEALPEALRPRRRRHLDKIGDALKPAADHLGINAPRGGWSKWWQGWRASHERRGVLGLLGLRRR
jgi:hypothetical protein